MKSLYFQQGGVFNNLAQKSISTAVLKLKETIYHKNYQGNHHVGVNQNKSSTNGFFLFFSIDNSVKPANKEKVENNEYNSERCRKLYTKYREEE